MGVVFYEMLTGELPIGRFEPPSKKVQIDVRLDEVVTCPLKTNLNLERESKDSGVCKEAGNDEEAIHERTDYPQAEGSRS